MIVLKVGGSVVSVAELGELDDAVVVHGAGPQITAAMAGAGLTQRRCRSCARRCSR